MPIDVDYPWPKMSYMPQGQLQETLGGDAAAATLIRAVDSAKPFLGPFVYGSDGRGAANLIVPSGGMRCPRTSETGMSAEDENGNIRCADNLFMDGAEVFNFTLRVVPKSVNVLLGKAGLSLDAVDLFVFHQANRYMLEHLRKRINLPSEKFLIRMAHCGNTVSSTIPIALHHAVAESRLKKGNIVMLVGFGVGYSWGATLLRWE